MPTTHAASVEPSTRGKPERSDPPRGRSAPETVNGSTHVNVAFPFSQIKVQDPSKELRELAVLVDDLIAALESKGGAELQGLRERSKDLAGRLN